MAPDARAAPEEVGIYVEGHRAKQINRITLERADLILVMSPQRVSELSSPFGELPGEVGTLSGYGNDGTGVMATSAPTVAPRRPTAPPCASF